MVLRLVDTLLHFAAEVDAAEEEEAGPAKRIKVEGGWSGQPEGALPSGAAECPIALVIITYQLSLAVMWLLL